MSGITRQAEKGRLKNQVEGMMNSVARIACAFRLHNISDPC